MAKPTFLRYLPARLKPLSAPAVWVPLALFSLIGVFLWEYHKNPDWFDREPLTVETPDSGLSEEEQASLSEIDTLDVLGEGTRPIGSLSTENSSAGADATGEEAASADPSSASSRQLSGKKDPFAPYAADYEFPGSAVSATLTPGNLSSSASTGSSLPTNGSTPSFNFGSGLVNPTAPAVNSALSEAINRQQEIRAAEAARGAGTAAPSASLAESAEFSSGLSRSGAPGSGGQAGEGSAPSSGGIPAPYIRTTTEMSPPVGTTGYNPPASSRLPVFNRPLQEPTRNPYSAPPQSAQGAAQPSSQRSGGAVYTGPTFTQPPQNQQVNQRPRF